MTLADASLPTFGFGTREIARLQRLLAYPRRFYKRRNDRLTFPHAKYVHIDSTISLVVPALHDELTDEAAVRFNEEQAPATDLDYFVDQLGPGGEDAISGDLRRARPRLINLGFFDKRAQRGLTASDCNNARLPIMPIPETAQVLAAISTGALRRKLRIDFGGSDEDIAGVLRVLNERLDDGTVFSKLIEWEPTYDTSTGEPIDNGLDPACGPYQGLARSDEYQEFIKPFWAARFGSRLGSDHCFRRIIYKFAELSGSDQPGSRLASRLIEADEERMEAWTHTGDRDALRSLFGDIPQSQYEGVLRAFTHTIHRLAVLRAGVHERVVVNVGFMQEVRYDSLSSDGIEISKWLPAANRAAVPHNLFFRIPNATHCESFRLEVSPPSECTVEYALRVDPNRPAIDQTIGGRGKLVAYSTSNNLERDEDEEAGEYRLIDPRLAVGVQLQRHGLVRQACFVLALMVAAFAVAAVVPHHFFGDSKRPAGGNAGALILALPTVALGLVAQTLKDSVTARFASLVRASLYGVSAFGFLAATISALALPETVGRFSAVVGFYVASLAFLELGAVGFLPRFRVTDDAEDRTPRRGAIRGLINWCHSVSGYARRCRPRSAYAGWDAYTFLQGELQVARRARFRYQVLSVLLTAGVIALGQMG